MENNIEDRQALPVEEDLFQQALRLQTAGLVLTRLFLKTPDRGVIGQFQNPEMLVVWPLHDAVSKQGIEALQTALADNNKDMVEGIADDYLRLFGGAGRAYAHPCESVWLSQSNLVFDVQTLEVRHAYARLGLQLTKLGTEPDDHIGFQLSFITQAIARIKDQLEQATTATNGTSSDSADKGLPLLQPGVVQEFAADTDAKTLAAFLQQFLDEHTLRFSPQFTDALRRHAKTVLYKASAELLDGFLEQVQVVCRDVANQ